MVPRVLLGELGGGIRDGVRATAEVVVIDFETLKKMRRALENVARAIDAFVDGLRKFFEAFPHIEMELLREPAGRLDFSLARPAFAARRQRARAGGVWSGPSTSMRRRPRSW